MCLRVLGGVVGVGGVSTIRRSISSELADASAVAKLSTIRKVITAITARSNQLKSFSCSHLFFRLPAG